MELRDGPHQCQSKSGTAQLSGAGIIHPEKGLENPLAERFRDAGSLVGNHDLEPFPIPVARDVYNAAGGLYLTAFSTRLHTACRSSSAFPARVQGAASTKMVMLRASAWGAAWSAALRISWPEESRSPRDARSRLVSSKSSLTMADQAVHLPLDDLEQLQCGLGAEVLLFAEQADSGL